LSDRPADDWVTAQAAAELLGLQANTIYRLIDTGELEAEQGAGLSGSATARSENDATCASRRQAIEDFLYRARVKPGELRHLNPEGSRTRYRDGNRPRPTR
jgi:predicted DNA-binding transcriptional regulator AlpA